MLVTLGIAIFYLQSKPFESKQRNRLEVFNECTILAATHTLICFTLFVVEAAGRHDAGFGFISLVYGYITVQISLMLVTVGHWAKLRAQRQYNKR